MKRRMWLTGALVALLWATPAKADTGVIVRTTGGLPALQLLCSLPLSPCTVVGALDGTLGQVFLVTTPLPFATFQGLLGGMTGFVNAEVDQVLNLVGPNLVPASIPRPLISDRSSVPYGGTNVWNSYVNQPAAGIIKVPQAQSQFKVSGNGIVAEIDTGVDPTHPALQGVLLAGYDFTRNQAGGSELNDLTTTDFPTYPPATCSSITCPSPAKVNQSTAAVLDQSTAAVLDGKVQYAAFGHGTMVMGVIHLVAPTAKLLPLKAFHSNGTGNLSDILRAIYYAVQNNANAINMSFDFKTASTELQNALGYANQLNVICAGSAGNDRQGPPNLVYPAALQTVVMGVASTSDTDARSSFSNYGNAIVWVAAPGEAIVTTYPFSTYSAGWGTSFSAPFVSGGAALLRNLRTDINESLAASAVAHAQFVGADMGNGRLDLLMALTALPAGGGSPDFSAFAAPSNATIAAGQETNFTVSAAPVNGFNQTVNWNCTGAPTGATCTVLPVSVTLDGKNAATATVKFTTMARALTPPMFLPRYAPPRQPWWVLVACFAWLAAAVMMWNLSRASRTRWPGLAAAAGLLAVSLCSYSCGGGYGNAPGSATLSAIALNPSSVNGGSPSTGTVTLSGPAPSGGATVSLSSGNTAAATVPASVTVAAGATSATFTVSTSAVTTSTPVTLSASYAGATKMASLTVNPPPGTPAGTYTLTITGSSGSLSHATTVQVKVN
jgi:hypothetical protein